MKKNLTILAMILVTYLLQSTLRVLIPAQYPLPNMLLVLTCSLGLMRGKRAGMLTGFLSGLLYDLFFGNIFGLTALCFLYIGFFNGFLYKVFFDNDIRIPMAAVGVSDLIYNLILMIIAAVMHHHVSVGPFIRGTILPEVITSVLWTIPIYYIYRLINRSIVVYEAETEQSPWLRR